MVLCVFVSSWRKKATRVLYVHPHIINGKTQSMKKINWGLIGPGKVTHAFVKDLQLLEHSRVSAVASRSAAKAEAFAEQYDIPNRYGSYAELFQDEEVDIVYIATPPNSHAELGIAAMNAGKHALIETPLAVNSAQAQELIAASRRNGVFLMEAFWVRFIPAIRECLELAQNKTIGDITYITADLTTPRSNLDADWRLDMGLGGGALMTRASYPVALAYMILGKPQEVVAAARFHRTGADKQVSAILKYENGIANIMGGFVSNSDMVGRIYGTAGSILLDPWWYETESFTIVENGGESRAVKMPKQGKGFTHEIDECVRCIRAGKIQSDLWSHRHSLEWKGIIDEIRMQIGLKYPFE